MKNCIDLIELAAQISFLILKENGKKFGSGINTNTQVFTFIQNLDFVYFCTLSSKIPELTH